MLMWIYAQITLIRMCSTIMLSLRGDWVSMYDIMDNYKWGGRGLEEPKNGVRKYLMFPYEIYYLNYCLCQQIILQSTTF